MRSPRSDTRVSRRASADRASGSHGDGSPARSRPGSRGRGPLTPSAAIELAPRPDLVLDLHHAAAVAAEFGEIGVHVLAFFVLPGHPDRVGLIVVAHDRVNAPVAGGGDDGDEVVLVELLAAALGAPFSVDVLERKRGGAGAAQRTDRHDGRPDEYCVAQWAAHDLSPSGCQTRHANNSTFALGGAARRLSMIFS